MGPKAVVPLPVLLALLLLPLPSAADEAAAAGPRVATSGEHFVDASGSNVVLIGPNVVMKGPPWIPSVACNGTCHHCVSDGTSCQTFTTADVAHIKSLDCEPPIRPHC